MKCNNIHIIEISEGEEKEQGIENLFEKIMMETFPNLVREKVMQDQEAQSVTIKMNPKISTPRHIKMANFKDKERILNAEREKWLLTYKGALIRLSGDFSTETLQARRDWHEISQVIKARIHNQDYSTQQGSH